MFLTLVVIVINWPIHFSTFSKPGLSNLHFSSLNVRFIKNEETEISSNFYESKHNKQHRKNMVVSATKLDYYSLSHQSQFLLSKLT